MGFQVIISKSPILALVLPFFFSCQNFYQPNEHLGHSNESEQALNLNDKIGFFQKKLKSNRFEFEWVNLRKEILSVEIRAQESQLAILKLERELSKFQDFEDRFPDKKGFFSEEDRIEWQSRLDVKKSETKRLHAVVRLLKRDMMSLKAKLHRNGYKAIQNATFEVEPSM